MGKYDGIMLVSDMDATLLNDDHRVSDKNREAIEYFMDEGGMFTVATGRMVQAVREYFKQMSINAPAILHNGAKIYDFVKDKSVFERFIENDRKESIRRVYNDMPDVGLEVYSNEKVYVYRPCSETERFKTKPYDVCYTLPENVWDEPWIKVLLIGERELLDRYEPIYRAHYDSGNCVRSGSMYLDVVANGVSKGLALEKLADIYGLNRDNVYAVGDNMNDIDMIKRAGVSCAVSNAEDEVIAAADIVVPSCNDDAIAYIIKNVIR